MDKNWNLKLFSLLSDASLVTNEKMENAYVCFTGHMKAVSQSETDYSEVYRMLNDARIELAFLQTLYRYEEGEKCPEICLP